MLDSLLKKYQPKTLAKEVSVGHVRIAEMKRHEHPCGLPTSVAIPVLVFPKNRHNALSTYRIKSNEENNLQRRRTGSPVVVATLSERASSKNNTYIRPQIVIR